MPLMQVKNMAEATANSTSIRTLNELISDTAVNNKNAVARTRPTIHAINLLFLVSIQKHPKLR